MLLFFQWLCLYITHTHTHRERIPLFFSIRYFIYILDMILLYGIKDIYISSWIYVGILLLLLSFQYKKFIWILFRCFKLSSIGLLLLLLWLVGCSSTTSSSIFLIELFLEINSIWFIRLISLYGNILVFFFFFWLVRLIKVCPFLSQFLMIRWCWCFVLGYFH